MKVVFVIRHFFPFIRPSGPTSFIRELSEELDRQGINLSIICLRKKGEASNYQFANIPVYKFHQLNLLQYRQLIKKIDPDSVVHISSISGGILLFIWWYLLFLIANTPKTLFFQVTNLHNVKYFPIALRILRQYKQCMVTSRELKNFYKEQFSLETIKIFPGLNLKKTPKLKTSQHSSIKKIAFFGHVSYVKGPDFFVALSKKCTDFDFMMVASHGSKNKRDIELMKEVKQHSLLSNNFKYIGDIDNPLEIMSECDLLILPYRTGNTVLGVAQSAIEAMAMGIPVIGTKNNALDELIIDGYNGYFAESVDEIQHRLEVLKKEPETYLKLCKNAKTTTNQKFSIENSALQLLELLK